MEFIWIALIRCQVSGCIYEEQFDYEFVSPSGITHKDFRGEAIREFLKLGWTFDNHGHWRCKIHERTGVSTSSHSSLATRPSSLAKEAA